LSQLPQFAFVVFLSMAGWAVAERLRVPAAGFLGPLLFVGGSAILGVPQPQYPAWSVIACQVIFGTFLGCQADRDSVARVRALGRPVALATAWTILSAFAIAALLALLSGVDLTTSFLSAVPGGVAEMSAMSIGMQADTAIVATMQSLRVIATMAIIPVLTRRMAAPATVSAADTSASSRSHRISADAFMIDDVAPQSPVRANNHVLGWLASLAVGMIGSGLFLYLHVPAGGIVGALASVAAGRIVGLPLRKPPQLLRLIALLGMGSYIGTTFSDQTLVQLRGIVAAAVVVTAATVVSGMALAKVLERRAGMDPATALLACAPAGVTQMAVIADEIGSDVLVVALFQLTRLMCAVFILPLLFRFVL
jgi:hypothetical protein